MNSCFRRHGRFLVTSIIGALLVPSLPVLKAQANERVLPAAQLLREGYLPTHQAAARLLLKTELPAAHSLAWPVQFQDDTHTIGNSMAQFQPFGDPYFHGGCDLRVEAGADIHAPVDGKLEAGYYSYATGADGSLQKFWKAWPEDGDPTYFEVAVVASNGIRYEFHHINHDTLPDSIVALLNAGGGTVAVGTVLGHVITWPDGDYHHTHYNVVLPEGTRVNPEFVSPLLPDHLAPAISAAYAVNAAGEAQDFGDGTFAAPSLAAFVIDVIDKQDGNVYEHPPVWVRLKFASGPETLWDFRQTLLAPSGAFPDLFSFFRADLTAPNGLSVTTEGGYGLGSSLVQLAIPVGALGPFTIEIGDLAGNLSTLKGQLN